MCLRLTVVTTNRLRPKTRGGLVHISYKVSHRSCLLPVSHRHSLTLQGPPYRPRFPSGEGTRDGGTLTHPVLTVRLSCVVSVFPSGSDRPDLPKSSRGETGGPSFPLLRLYYSFVSRVLCLSRSWDYGWFVWVLTQTLVSRPSDSRLPGVSYRL